MILRWFNDMFNAGVGNRDPKVEERIKNNLAITRAEDLPDIFDVNTLTWHEGIHFLQILYNDLRKKV